MSITKVVSKKKGFRNRKEKAHGSHCVLTVPKDIAIYMYEYRVDRIAFGVCVTS